MDGTAATVTAVRWCLSRASQGVDFALEQLGKPAPAPLEPEPGGDQAD